MSMTQRATCACARGEGRKKMKRWKWTIGACLVFAFIWGFVAFGAVAQEPVAYFLDGAPVYEKDIVTGVNDVATLLGEARGGTARREGAKLVLGTDVTLPETVFIRKSVELDLGGHTLTCTTGTALRVQAQNIGTQEKPVFDGTPALYLYSGAPGGVVRAAGTAFFCDDNGTIHTGKDAAGTLYPNGNLRVYAPRMSVGYGQGLYLFNTVFCQNAPSSAGALFTFDSAGYVKKMENCTVFVRDGQSVLDAKSLQTTITYRNTLFVGGAHSVLAANGKGLTLQLFDCAFVGIPISPGEDRKTTILYKGNTHFDTHDENASFEGKVGAFGAPYSLTYTDVQEQTCTRTLYGTFAAPDAFSTLVYEGTGICERWVLGATPVIPVSAADGYFEDGYWYTPDGWIFSVDGEILEDFTKIEPAHVGKTLHARAGAARVRCAFAVYDAAGRCTPTLLTDKDADAVKFADAINGAAEATRVVLGTDLSLRTTVKPSVSMQLDLAGHTLSFGGITAFHLNIGGLKHEIYSSAPGARITVGDGGVFLFTDKTPDVTVGACGAYSGDNLTVCAPYLLNGWTNGAKVRLLGGTYICRGNSSAAAAFVCQGAVLDIRDATVRMERAGAALFTWQKNIPMQVVNTTFSSPGDGTTVLVRANGTLSAQVCFTDCSFAGLDLTPSGTVQNLLFTATDSGRAYADRAYPPATTGAMHCARVSESGSAGEQNVQYRYTLLPDAADTMRVRLTLGGAVCAEEIWQKGQTPQSCVDKEGWMLAAAASTPCVQDTDLAATLLPGTGKLVVSLKVRESLTLSFAAARDGVLRRVILDGRTYDMEDTSLPTENREGVPYVRLTYDVADGALALLPVSLQLHVRFSDGVQGDATVQTDIASCAERVISTPGVPRQTVRTAVALVRYLRALAQYFAVPDVDYSVADRVLAAWGEEEYSSYPTAGLYDTVPTDSAVLGVRIEPGVRPVFLLRVAPDYTGEIFCDGTLIPRSAWRNTEVGRMVPAAADVCRFGTVTVRIGGDGKYPPRTFTYTLDHYIAAIEKQEENAAAVAVLNRLMQYVTQASLYAVSSGVVGKGGSRATISFVVDDGRHPTAEYVMSLLDAQSGNRLQHLAISFALIANHYATLTTEESTDGKRQYVMTEDGRYIYTVRQEEVNYWLQLFEKNPDMVEVLSHSYTHSYAGENDEGGEVTYTTSWGTTHTAQLARGSVTAEIVASKQIFDDLFGAYTGLCFVRPGVGVGQTEYFYDVLRTCGRYIGSRDTNYAVITRDNLEEYRWCLPGRMTTHDSSAADNISQIDKTIRQGGWSAFCVHYIHPDEQDAANRDNQSISQSKAWEIFSYANQKAEEGTLWIARLSDALLYETERAVARVETLGKEGDNTLAVTLHTDGLDREVYRMALTVRVEVPQGTAYVTHEGRQLPVRTDGTGSSYVLADVLPGETILLTLAGS